MLGTVSNVREAVISLVHVLKKIGRYSYKSIDTEKERESERVLEREGDRQTGTHSHTQTDRQSDIQRYRLRHTQ